MQMLEGTALVDTLGVDIGSFFESFLLMDLD